MGRGDWGGFVLEGAVPLRRPAVAAATMPAHALLLLAALAAAVVAQGGYYLPGRILATALAGVALVVALWHRGLSRADAPLVLLACVGLAGWAVIRAGFGGSVVAALPTLASVFCLAAALLVTARTDTAGRVAVASAAISIGTLVAVTGWIAVVWRIPSWTTVADGLVRAASTLTYPNAAGALLASLAVLAIARQRSITDAGATYLLLVGLGATLSRAGLLALAAGLAALAFLAGLRTVLRHAAPPGLGALVAIGALTPSFSITAPARPAVAILGLAAGLGLTIGLNRLRTKALAVLLLAGLALAAVALATRSSLIHGRVGISSPDRAGASSAALNLVASRPLAGIGPGQTWFSWTAANGQVRIGHYVHNEYLQVLVELGAIGLALVLCLLAAIVLTLRRARTGTLPAGAAAGLAALAVHSGFDFLWHIPAIVLTAGMLIGLATPINEKETM